MERGTGFMSDKAQGRYFEEFEIGDAMVTGEHVVTEEEIMAFARLTGDDNPMHTDPEYAETHMFGQQVAHGPLVLSIAVGLAWQLGFMQGTVLAFRDLEWKFSRPVFISDRIRVRAEVHQRKAMSRLGGGAVTFDVRVLNQDDEIVQRGKWNVLVQSKQAAQ
jgi:3-hydroxybutyryl-CoA dehydratase